MLNKRISLFIVLSMVFMFSYLAISGFAGGWSRSFSAGSIIADGRAVGLKGTAGNASINLEIRTLDFGGPAVIDGFYLCRNPGQGGGNDGVPGNLPPGQNPGVLSASQPVDGSQKTNRNGRFDYNVVAGAGIAGGNGACPNHNWTASWIPFHMNARLSATYNDSGGDIINPIAVLNCQLQGFQSVPADLDAAIQSVASTILNGGEIPYVGPCTNADPDSF